MMLVSLGMAPNHLGKGKDRNPRFLCKHPAGRTFIFLLMTEVKIMASRGNLQLNVGSKLVVAQHFSYTHNFDFVRGGGR
jgi:hypothetical protein